MLTGSKNIISTMRHNGYNIAFVVTEKRDNILFHNHASTAVLKLSLENSECFPDTTDDEGDAPEETWFKELNADAAVSKSKSGEERMGKEFNDIAATARSLQPTGYTLETTKVAFLTLSKQYVSLVRMKIHSNDLLCSR